MSEPSKQARAPRAKKGASAGAPAPAQAMPWVGLRYTGHALVDVGLAGLCAFAKKQRPEELGPDDLDRAADFMEGHYYEGKLNSFLTCVFMNSSFVQPNEGAEKKAAFVAQYLRAHRAAAHPDVAGRACVFSGEAATSPMVRTHLPMFSGEGVRNFRPDGQTSVPVAGGYVVAIMFLPLACLRSEGRLLAVHADEPELTLRFARRYLENHRRLLALPLPTARAPVFDEYAREIPSWDSQNKRYKYADAKGPRSLVVSDLAAVGADAAPTARRPRPVAITAYHLSSSGQGASLELFQLPAGLVSFVLRAQEAPTRAAWEALTKRFWPVSGGGDEGEADAAGEAPKKRRTKKAVIAGRAGWSKNPAFDELCAIFDAGFTDRGLARRWLGKHVLGRLERQAKTTYGRADARSWALAELFLTEVLGMKKGRIEVIRGFADKLAQWIFDKGDKRLLGALLYDKLSELDFRLRRAQHESASGTLLFGLDEHRDVWLHDDGDRYLVRDLVSIRVIERLHALGYFKAHPDALPQAERDDEGDARAGAQAGEAPGGGDDEG